MDTVTLSILLTALALVVAFCTPWLVLLSRAERNTDRALRLAEDLRKVAVAALDELERRS